MPTPLDYASTPRTRAPPGPLLVKPPRRALRLALLTAATAAWLAARHHPWTRTASLVLTSPAWNVPSLRFTPDGNLLAYDRSAAHVRNPATGQLLRTFDVAGDPEGRVFPTPDGSAVLTRSRGVLTLHDARSGSAPLTVAMRATESVDFLAADNAGRRFITHRADHPATLDYFRTAAVTLWDLDAPRASPGELIPIATVPGWWAAISPDGRRVAISTHPSAGTPSTAVFDFASRVASFKAPAREVDHFSADSRRLTLREDSDGKGSRTARVVDALTGRELTTPIPIHASRWSTASDDSRSASLDVFFQSFGPSRPLRVRPLVAPGPPDPPAETTALVTTTPGRGQLLFFPDDRRLFAPGPDPYSMAIYDTPSLRALAVFRDYPHRIIRAAAAPGSKHLAIADFEGTTTVYQPTGPDCPESPIGALAFPHLWLLALLTTALALTHRRDARRAAHHLPPTTAMLSLALLFLALPRTRHCLIGLCIGERILTPAPILLLASIALATGHNLHRLATLILLAATLPLELYCLHRLRQLGLD
ncbi:MAG TPA: hypothetical protein VMZ71_07595, partial [Gemmataceae bacterium]|nr:hypothetical protein [Gemmataceae bacterium]